MESPSRFAHAPHQHPESWPLWVGATHFDEIPYVFGAPLLQSTKYSIAERDLSASIMDAWTSFAKTGFVDYVLIYKNIDRGLMANDLS